MSLYLKKLNNCLILTAVLSFGIMGAAFAHPSTDVQSGIESLKAGKLEAAEGDFQKARFQEPENPGILYDLGIVNYEKREFQKAAIFFAKAVELTKKDSDRKNALYNLGNSLYRFGDYEKAIGAYKQRLELGKDDKTEYNLKVAEEKLAKRQEEQKKQQQNQDQKQNGNQNQKQDGNQQQDNKDGQSKDQSGDQNNQKKSGQNKDGQNKDGQNKDGKNKDGQDDQKGKDGQQQQANAGDKDKKENKNGSEQKSGEDKKSDKDQNGKQGEGEQKDQKRNREMVKMDDPGKKGPEKPKASQRARALKNKKLNPYMIEKILKQMQEREKEAQRYYRAEPNRRQELDPFRMSPSELRDFMRGKRPQSPDKDPNTQDW